MSGLLTITLRGSLAEYIVGLALDVDMESPREDWLPGTSPPETASKLR